MIGHVHVSDCDGKVHGDMPPGRGVTPIKEYLQAILDTGFTGTVSVELERMPEPDRMVELVEEAYRETARILAELGARERRGVAAGPFDLTGRRALVTGGGGGIGRGLARALADAGASVAVLGRSESADEAAAELRRPSPFAPTSPTATTCAAASTRRSSALGGLDILVNSHGIGRPSDAVDHELADWDAVIEMNLTATFELCRLAGRIMVDQGSGKIVNIASLLSFQGGLRVSSYAASKGGVSQLTMALANEWAPHGVNVNAIAPGYVKTAAERAHLARRPGADASRSTPASPPAAGASPPTSAAPSSSSPRPPRTTCTA